MSEVGRLRPEVLAFASGPFRLARDLERLEAVRGVDAPEAAVLYAARVVEALASAAVAALGIEPGTSCYGTLVNLEDMGLLDELDVTVGHTVRRLGNAVRHVGYAPEPEDAEIVGHLLGAWLDWFFRRRAGGPALASLTMDGGPWPPRTPGGTGSLLDALRDLAREGRPLPAPARAALSAPGRAAHPGGAALLALGAELEIRRGALEDADALLARGLADAPSDVRLVQLAAFLASRRGDPAEAIRRLEPLRRRQPTDDETAGILAGALKRVGLAEDGTPALERAHRIYRDAWRGSGRENAYLGINAATTALLLGRTDAAEALAGEVRALLDAREATLERGGVDTSRLPYYTQVMRAEALLLAGEPAAAARHYQRAFRTYAARKDDISGTRAQADRILAAAGRTERIDAWLDAG